MKKLFLSFVAVLIGSMTANAATYNKALLQHNDEVTPFDADKIQDAVDAAVDGDIIYLSEGTFKSFNVTKMITVRGVGETSVVNGNVTINIPNTPTLTNPVLETLFVNGSVTVNSALSNLLFRQCKINSSLSLTKTTNGGKIEKCQIGSVSFSGTIRDLIIDRCRISGFTLSSSIQSMTVVNTYINALNANSDATNNTNFVNCNLYFNDPSYFSGTIINSIVSHTGQSNKALKSTELINSLIVLWSNPNYTYSLSLGSSCFTENCYTVNSTDTDVASLQDNGYLGTDGKVVGIYGGDNPYDDNMLVAKVPKVTSSDLDLDLEQKKLNVTLTVSPQ